jgi:putative acetyltransferase
MLEAKKMGFKNCYLETLPYMKSAVKLYKKTGFVALDAPLGNTGHYSCTEWMIKEL